MQEQINATKRRNANSSTAYALLGEGGEIQHVFEDKALAEAVLEDWRTGAVTFHGRIESVDLVHSSLDELTDED